MASRKSKKRKIKEPQIPPESIVKNVNIAKQERPFVDISYLHSMTRDLSHLKKFSNPKCNLKIFQKFCNFFSNHETLDEAINGTKGNNGVYISAKECNYVKKVIDEFKKEYKKYELLDDDRLVHLHITQEFVVFGFEEDNRFVVLDFDPIHAFDK